MEFAERSEASIPLGRVNPIRNKNSNGASSRFLKFTQTVGLAAVFAVASLFLFSGSAQATSPFFSDSFTSDASDWTPASGAWVAEGGEYKHKNIGENYTTQSSAAMFSDDFSNSNPEMTTTTPFADTFTQADGPASQWTPKRGTFNVVNNEYAAQTTSATLSIPTTDYSALTDYRITTRVKREGAADASGYSLLYFRATMNGNNDNSYALLVRQNGYLHIYKRTNGSFDGLAVAQATIPKDNNWHDIIIRVIGTTVKVWFDNAEDQFPTLTYTGLAYAAGTIGVGTNSWASEFDNVQVDSISSSSYRWLDKNGLFTVQDGGYRAKGTSGLLSVIADSGSASWNNYKITTKIKRYGAVDASGYAKINFRTSMASATLDNSYAMVFKQTGTAQLLKVTSGSGVGVGTTFAIPKDNDWHDVIIKIVDTTVSVWFDKAESDVPDLKYKGLTDYDTGTIGIGTMDFDSSFDDFTVEPIMSVTAAPSILYSGSNNTTTLTISSSVDLDNLELTAVNPSGTLWVASPSGCVGNKTCQAVFPTDFSGANINIEGTYKITATSGNDVSYVLLEAREEPLFSFMHITDTHSNFDFSDTVGSEMVPPPDFVVSTGDTGNPGGPGELAATLTQAKTGLDNLTPVPYYITNGNHDVDTESGNDRGHLWSDTFGADKFSYSWANGNFLFLSMDILAPYGGFGSVLNSAQHITWLQNILDANPAKKVFLFSHFALKEIRNGGGAQNYWNLESNSTALRSILESHGNVIAQFAGHDHLNGVASWNGINYFTTASFKTNGEYRYIEVYGDRIESHTLKKSTYNYDYYNALWPGSTDLTHTASTYSYGLPLERQFRIDLTGRSNDILDGITTAGSASWGDYTYQTNVTLGNEGMLGENVAGVVFRYTDANNYYSVLLDSAADTIKLQKKVAGVVSSIGDSVSTTISIDTPYELKVTTQGNNIEILLDDVSKIDTTDAAFAAGKIGLKTYRASTQYDDVSVIDLGNPNSFTLSSPVDNGTVASYQPTFTWNASTDNESGIAKYQLYIDDTLNKDNINGTSATSTGTLPYGDHAWYVKAVDEAGNSTSSAAFNLTVSDFTAPSSFTLSSPENDSATFEAAPTFSWNASTDSESSIAKYQLYIDDVLDTDNINAVSITPTDDLSCGSHTWYVKAVDNAVNSTSSAAFNLTKACAIEDDGNDLDISEVEYHSTENTITITWETNNDADSKVEYGKDRDMDRDEEDDDNEEDHKIVLKNLDPDTLYYFKIRSEDENGSEDSSDRKSIRTKKANSTPSFSNSFFSPADSGDGKENSENQNEEEKDIIDQINEIPEKIQEKLEETKFFNADVFKKADKKYLSEVKFQIIDELNNPIPNLAIILHSDPQMTTTDENGYATFTDVKTGKHTLAFNYNNQNRKFAVNIAEPKTESGEVKMETVVIKVEEKQNNWIYYLAGILAIAVVLLIFRRKRKKSEGEVV